MIYQVKFYKGSYKERQYQANKDKAVCYIEHHFNSFGKDENQDGYTDPNDINYGMAIVGTNASKRSKEWASYYAKQIKHEFYIKIKQGNPEGVVIGGFNKRGNANVYYTQMPAILVEPFFLSCKDMLELLCNDWEGVQSKLSCCLVESITKFFPKGLIAFSVGHKYKGGKAEDLGCAIKYSYMKKNEWWKRIFYCKPEFSKTEKVFFEAILAEKVLLQAKEILESL